LTTTRPVEDGADDEAGDEAMIRAEGPLSSARERELSETARRLRVEVLRMTARAGSGHPGGSLSAADIMACLYFEVMRLDPERPDWPERDRFVLSKGHAAPVLYAALALRGFFPRRLLATLRQVGSPLQGHPHMRAVPGVEVSTGSLGQGLSMACGMALAARLDRSPGRVYCLLGDGESQEGMVWEAAAAASHYGLGNLTALLDRNGLQIDGRTEEVMSVEPVRARWEAFGWRVREVNGHSVAEIVTALREAQSSAEKPSMIVCHTVKGKGVSFMEDKVEWHGKAPNAEQLARALADLGEPENPAAGGDDPK
jgi:transketolase